MNSYLFRLQLGVDGNGLVSANEQRAIHLDEGLHGCLPAGRLEEGVDGVKDPILSNKKREYQFEVQKIFVAGHFCDTHARHYTYVFTFSLHIYLKLE